MQNSLTLYKLYINFIRHENDAKWLNDGKIKKDVTGETERTIVDTVEVVIEET